MAAIEALKQREELFRVACDHGDERLDRIRNRILAGEVLDEAAMADGGGGDLLRALPDDVLRLILLCLSSAAAAAARTGLISSRWRNLWSTLPELWFPVVTDLARVSAALRLHAAPVLHHLEVGSYNPAPHEIAAVLATAARRLDGVLLFRVTGAGAWAATSTDIGGALEIPCFPKATEIDISLGYLRIRLPLFAIFAKLKMLHLIHVRFDSQCDIGDAVSSDRGPLLRELTLCRAKGLSNLAICSESLLQVYLSQMGKLQQLTIVAPMLRELAVRGCFKEIAPIADISAPVLEKLEWIDYFSCSSVRLGVMPLPCLRRLAVYGLVYGLSTTDPHLLSLPLL